jgi:hypothetical protein
MARPDAEAAGRTRNVNGKNVNGKGEASGVLGHFAFVGGLGVAAGFFLGRGHLFDGFGVEAGGALEAFQRFDAGAVALVLFQSRFGLVNFAVGGVLGEPGA